MRGLVQRVSEAHVDAPDDDGVRRETGRIGPGVVLLVGVTHADGEAEADRLAERVARLRIHPDDDGVMNRSLLDVGGAALGIEVATGRFRTHMRVALVNDRPVTILLET
jgi:D-tyrosyl-tRNA(Tyr) deacylase